MKEFIHGKVGLDHLDDVIEQTEKGSDRDLAIILGSFVENCLRMAIERKIETSAIFSGDRLWSFNGPLGTFSSKIEIARAFRLISDLQYHHLMVIKKIRNHCAHSLGISSAESVSFETDPIKQYLQNLYPQKILGQVDHETAEKIKGTHEYALKTSPRLMFRTIVYAYCFEHITGRAFFE